MGVEARLATRVLAALVLAAASPAALLAQTPVPDVIATAPAPPAGAASPPITSSADPAPPAPPASIVQVAPLTQLDLFSAGRDVGLGPDLWKGSSADIARVVIPTLGRRPLSPAGAALAERLLSQPGTAPDGAGSDIPLAAARAKALLALGDAPLVDQIADRTANLAGSADFSQVAAEAALITDQTPKACAIGDALAEGRDQIYWLRLRAFCQVIAGKTDAAQLTFTLANQQGKDAVYARLMGALLTGAGAGGAGPASLRDGLDYALSRQLKLDLEPAVPQASAAIAAHLAASVPPPPPPPPPSGPVTAIPPPAGSEADLLAVLRGADSSVQFNAAAKSVAPQIAAIVATKAAFANPIQMATAALAAGDLTTAQAIVSGLPASEAGAAITLDRAILDASLAAATGKPCDPASLARLADLATGQAGGDRARAQASLAIAAALADPTDTGVRAAIAGLELGRNDAPASRLMALDIAAAEGLRGEAGLLALAVAQFGGAGGPHPADRARLVRALRLAGLGDDARAFALEGLIAQQSR